MKRTVYRFWSCASRTLQSGRAFHAPYNLLMVRFTHPTILLMVRFTHPTICSWCVSRTLHLFVGLLDYVNSNPLPTACTPNRVRLMLFDRSVPAGSAPWSRA